MKQHQLERNDQIEKRHDLEFLDWLHTVGFPPDLMVFYEQDNYSNHCMMCFTINHSLSN